MKKDDIINKTVYEIYVDLDNDNKLSRIDLNICYDDLLNNEIMKCSNYSIESVLDGLCISCSDSFAPKYNDSLNVFGISLCNIGLPFYS